MTNPILFAKGICYRPSLKTFCPSAAARFREERGGRQVPGAGADHGGWRLEAGLKKLAGTGPVTAVTGLTGPDWFRYRAVRNRTKFKI